MATKQERKTARLIKKVDATHWADREARGKLEDQIEGPFASGFFTYNDDQSAASGAIERYRVELDELNNILSYRHPSNELSAELKSKYQAQATHYSNMIDLLS